MNKLFCALKQISVIAFISLVMPSQAVVADSIVQTADSPGKISVETQTRAKLLQDAAAGGIYFPSRTPSTFKANTAAPAAASGASASIISPAAATGTHAETTGPQVLQPPSAQALEVKPIISVPAKSSTPVITESQVAVTGKTDKNLKPFLAVVRANFSAWDQNHDGTIDRKEIEVAAQDAKYTGDAAAALAVLKIDADAKIAAKKELGLSRLSDIDTIQSKSDSGEKIDSDFGKIFARCQYKLKTVPRQLYIDALPHLSMIHQGSTLDCYFLASLGGLLETNPRVIIDMIQQNPDGTYNVVFPGKPPLIISAPTETELAAYTHSNDGFWLNIIEKAYGMIRHIAPQNYTAEPLDAVALNRGSCGEVIRLLTGNSSTRLDFHKTPEVISSPTDTDLKVGTPANASDSSNSGAAAYPPADDEMLGKARALLKATFAAHKIATASKNRHAYTIVAYDIGHDLVTVHNPYGTNGFEKWPDGTKGPRMQNGYYICSIPEFVRYYRSISVEK